MPIYDFESRTRPGLTARRPGLRKRTLLAGLIVLPILIAFWSARGREPDPQPESGSNPGHSPGVERPAPASEDTSSADPQFVEISGHIRRGEPLTEALRREGFSNAQAFNLVSALRQGFLRRDFNPNVVRRGDQYWMQIDSLGAIHSFEYVRRGVLDTRYVAQRENGVLRARKERVPLERRVAVVSGRIEDMLWNAISGTGENPAVLSDKMIDIFEYDVDFMVDCRRGDTFSMSVEKFYKKDEFVSYGDILVAEYSSAKRSYQAFLFESPVGGAGYYDAEGRSLRGLFLKSPLNYRKITSRYAHRRYHPILKKYTPHHGIDYAADYGSPVWATADGVVTFIGWKGPLGNYVEVRHKNGYKTGYGHLSKFREGVKKGSRVKQKQVIGYLGATGRATGPHVHYNFFAIEGGRYRTVNPASVVNRPTRKPIPKSHAGRFLRHRDRLWALLDSPNGSIVTASLVSGHEAGERSGASSGNPSGNRIRGGPD